MFCYYGLQIIVCDLHEREPIFGFLLVFFFLGGVGMGLSTVDQKIVALSRRMQGVSLGQWGVNEKKLGVIIFLT